MGRILRTYVIKEVAFPTVIAILTITFILLIGGMNDLIKLMMLPDVEASQVLLCVLDSIPALLVMFATPMAILVGALIGVGRMALDREVLAIRASGLNLFRVFLPAIILTLVLSMVILYLSGTVIPRIGARGEARFKSMLFAGMNALEPGQVYDELGNNDDFVLYFNERDAETRQMKGVTLKLASEGKKSKEQDSDDKNKKEKMRTGDLANTPAPKDANGGQLAAPGTALAAGPSPTANDDKSKNNEGLSVVFAESGDIKTATMQDSALTKSQKGAILLQLNNGTIHRLNPDPAKQEYMVIRFDKLEKTVFQQMDERENRTRTNAELKAIVDENRKMANDKSLDKKGRAKALERMGKARKTLIERPAIALAGFVFALVGIPLAIWIRPTGKSWGIMIAIGLILLYYILLRMGLSMVEADKSIGVPLAFAPNLLFLLLGAGLWWHNLRS